MDVGNYDYAEALNLDLGLAEALSQFLSEIINFAMYVLQSIIGLILDIINLIISPFIGLSRAIMALFDSVYTFVTAYLSFLPSPWLVLMLLMLTIVVALRLYSFLKDISIHGYKV